MDKSVLIGSGTYGKVYKMNVNGRDVAVKFIKNDEDGMRELGEVNLLKKFNHPNILKRFDELFVLPDEIGIVLPIATTDLYNAHGVSGDTKERWVYELLSGMNFIHRNGYCHCDIKPANVLIIDDRAVISDLGLMGLEILKADTCQTIYNPQLLYKKSGRADKVLMTDPIYQKPFTNSQSDLWALGETIYYIANGMCPIMNDINKMNRYITDLLKIEGEFSSIIKTLMNPDPQELSINLMVLLGESPFNGKYDNYISGKINNDIQNKHPVIFKPEMKRDFNILFNWIAEVISEYKMSEIILFNTIDMFYRVFNLTKTHYDYQLFMSACFSLTTKIYNESVASGDVVHFAAGAFTKTRLFETERLIVQHLDGVLDRDLPVFYGVKLKKFKSWIVSNPEKYEQFNMAGLVREID